MKSKLDFLIIGAQKSATTTVYDWLMQHPDIFLPSTKEILYFAKDEFYAQGDRYLDVFYRDYQDETVTGGAYVHLMYFPQVAARIYEHNPSIKVIAVLRDPVARAYSAYWFARRNGWESCASFEEALALEPERIEGTYQEQAELTYASHGHYAEQLTPYFDYLGQERVKVIFTQSLKDAPEIEMQDVLAFLGLSHDKLSLDLSEKSNPSAMPVSPRLQKLLMTKDSWYKRAGRKLLPAGTRRLIRETVVQRVLEKNLRPYSYPPIDQATKAKLELHFQPHNARLSALLERALPW